MPTNKARKHSFRDTDGGRMDRHALGGVAGAAIGTLAGALGVTAAEVAVAGSFAGPAGAAMGAAWGGPFGNDIAQAVNLASEEKYWRNHFYSREYVLEGADYETYRPAYRYGIDAFSQYEGERFGKIEPHLDRHWSRSRGTSTLDWHSARPATRDAYERLYTNIIGKTDI